MIVAYRPRKERSDILYIVGQLAQVAGDCYHYFIPHYKVLDEKNWFENADGLSGTDQGTIPEFRSPCIPQQQQQKQFVTTCQGMHASVKHASVFWFVKGNNKT